MDLWIRSQSKEQLIPVKELIKLKQSISYNGEKYITLNDYCIYSGTLFLGEYKNKERALEILDEIQELLKGKNLLKFNTMVRPDNLVEWKHTYEIINKTNFMVSDSVCDITAISTNIVYEMPKE